MARTIQGSVVVITGASSGIGRRAALSFAARGAKLVLAARRDGALDDVAAACQALGAKAIAVPTDVTDEAAVQALARRGAERFGQIDTWINNAAVALYARFEEGPHDLFRRVIETNLFGYIHGSWAALSYFIAQGSGILINNASIAAHTGQAYSSAYAVSKAGIQMLGKCLREELTGEKHIHVCTILPSMTDTPIYQSAANYSCRAFRPLPPVLDARVVAESIVRLAQRPRREVIVGRAGHLVALVATLAPGMSERLAGLILKAWHFAGPPAPFSDGNVLAPMTEWASVSGGWRTDRTRRLQAVLSAGLARLARLA